MKWPRVFSEFRTMREVLAGKSLARFGDGEFKIALGAGYSREPANAELTAELAAILSTPDPRCLIGIPTMAKKGPKYLGWKRHAARFGTLVESGREYGSAFVTRPDSAPWIECPEFGQMVEKLWKGKSVVVVCEAYGSILEPVSRTAASVMHLECPKQRAYADIGRLERLTLALAPDVAILSAGPTATALAHRLARHGVHAVDMGSAGKFFGRVCP